MLFGDDLAGCSFGFHLNFGQKILMYDSADGSVRIIADSFLCFVDSEFNNSI